MLFKVTKTKLETPWSQSKSFFEAGATCLVDNAWRKRWSLDLNFLLDNKAVISVKLKYKIKKVPKKIRTNCCTAWNPA